jgi:hypothetical protein
MMPIIREPRTTAGVDPQFTRTEARVSTPNPGREIAGIAIAIKIDKIQID